MVLCKDYNVNKLCRCMYTQDKERAAKVILPTFTPNGF